MADNELRRHKIRAELYDNLLTEDPNDFAARVIADKPLTSKDVCNYAAQRGGADISAKAMEHAVDLYLSEMAYLLCNGFTVSTGIFSVRPKIKGVFNKATEQFNPEKHKISFDFNQGLRLRRELANVNVEITGVSKEPLNTAATLSRCLKSREKVFLIGFCRCYDIRASYMGVYGYRI